MSLRWHGLYPVIVMGMLAALSLWLARISQNDTVKSTAKQRHDPDYIVEAMKGKRFDEQGKLQYTLDADRVMHFPDDDSTELNNPRVLFLGRAEPLRMTAQFGQVSKDGKVVTMMNEVHVLREATKQRPEMTLTTDLLTVVPDDEYASTPAPVTITQENSVLHGTGMELNNITAVAKLKSRVRGTLTPKN